MMFLFLKFFIDDYDCFLFDDLFLMIMMLLFKIFLFDDYDIFYVDNISFFLDVKILFLTIKKVVLKEGINSDTAATIEPFNGTNL
jgi:hypothetical protein